MLEHRETRLIAIVRHGETRADGLLSDRGTDQVYDLAARLGQLITRPKETALILSSTAPRAEASAAILSRILGAPLELHELLWSQGSRRPPNTEAVYKLVRSAWGTSELVIVVTHMELVNLLPDLMGERDLGAPCYMVCYEPAQGIVLNYRGRSTTRI